VKDDRNILKLDDKKKWHRTRSSAVWCLFFKIYIQKSIHFLTLFWSKCTLSSYIIDVEMC